MFSMIKQTLHDSFNLQQDLASPEEIKENIVSGGKVKGTNMCILILAILIASIGLNMNSTAVIIGAMLISPLMGGIQAIGYGIAVNDLSASKKALVGLLYQVFICILTSTIYFSLTPIYEAHSEILARTTPSIWDVLIAICGGTAGIIGMTRKEKTNVIPGVAIATALMPPLCTAGYGLATRNLSYFLGAMYLFFINSYFICLSAVVILKVIKLPCRKLLDEQSKHKLYSKLITLGVITVIPSLIVAALLIGNTIETRNINSYINTELKNTGNQIVQMNVDKEEHVLEVALLGKQLSEKDIERLSGLLGEYGLEKYTLQIVQPNMDGVLTAEDLQNYFADGKSDHEIAMALKETEISGLKQQLDESQKKVGELERYVIDLSGIRQDLSVLYPSIREISMGIQKGSTAEGMDEYETLLVVLKTKESLTEQEKERLTEWFRIQTGEESVTLIEEPVALIDEPAQQ